MKQTLRGFASAVAAADGTTSVSQSSKHADAAAPVGSAIVDLVECPRGYFKFSDILSPGGFFIILIGASKQQPISCANLGRRSRRSFFNLIKISLYKDRGGPAQLGTRDWAGLKRHGADRDLARYRGQKRAAPGEFKSHARRHRAPKSGTWVGYNWV